MFNQTIRETIEIDNITALTDRGYYHANLISPTDYPENSMFSQSDWSKLHAAARSPVETVNAMVKNWAFASSICKQEPEFQSVALMCIYNMVNMNLRYCPLRLFPNSIH